MAVFGSSKPSRSAGVVFSDRKTQGLTREASTCVCILLGGLEEITEKPDRRISAWRFVTIIKTAIFKPPVAFYSFTRLAAVVYKQGLPQKIA